MESFKCNPDVTLIDRADWNEGQPTYDERQR